MSCLQLAYVADLEVVYALKDAQDVSDVECVIRCVEYTMHVLAEEAAAQQQYLRHLIVSIAQSAELGYFLPPL